MQCFIFDLQRFAQVAIEAGKSVTIDGVTYSAVSDSVLNLDDGEKVSGIASGSVTATLEGNSAVQITFDGKKSFEFSCAAEDDALAVVIQGKSIKFTSGTINCSTDGFSAAGEVSVVGTIANIFPFNLKLDIPDAGMNITLDDETKITAPEKVDATLTFPENVAEIVTAFKPLIAPLLNVDEDTANKIYDVVYKLISSPTTAQLEGTFSWNQDEKKLIISQDSNLALNILDYNLSMTAKEGNVDGMNFFAQFSEDDAAVGMKFTPSTDANASLDLKLYKNDSQICDGLINVTAGSIAIDILNGKTSVEKDTCVTFTQGDDTFQFKFDAAATLTYAADEEGISQFTFGKGDGKVDLTLYRDDKEILTANVEINGTITVDTRDYSIGMTKDTTAAIKINDSTYTLKATDDAGATVAFQDDKFVLTPKDGNGGVSIAIIKNNATVFGGELNVTGGTITFDPIEQKFSFTKGTKISFAIGDGSREIDLEVKDKDASFKVEADTEGNFTITPDTGDGSLSIALKQNGETVFQNNVTVNGSMTINPVTNLLTLNDGTTISLTLPDIELRLNIEVAGGDASGKISLNDGKFLYTPDEDGKALNIGLTLLQNDGTDFMTIPVNLETTNGSLGIDFVNNSFVFSKGNSFTINLGEYIVGAEIVDDDANISIQSSGDGNFKITPGKDDGSIKVNLTRAADSQTIFSGTVKIDGSISVEGTAGTLDTGTTVSITQGDYEINFTVTGDDGIVIAPYGTTGFILISPKSSNVALDASLKRNGEAILNGNIKLTRPIYYNPANNLFEMDSKTKFVTTIGNYEITLGTDSTLLVAYFNIEDDRFIITPLEGNRYNTAVVSIARDGTTIIDSLKIKLSTGSLIFDGANQSFGLGDGTEITTTFGDYNVTATAKGEAGMSFAITDSGLTVTPATGDGTLDITLSNGDQEFLTANVEILSGSFTLGENGAFTVAKDTELKIKFSDDYIINFKATDKAGGAISIGADGITFAPTSDDGGLQLTVKRGDDTRSASLDVTGSVTYKLDGSISLTKGTVVKNVFDDGNILTITANTDASGSILFNPQTGLTIKPATPDALTATLTTGDLEVAKFTSIDGSITYSNGIVTATNGTNANLRVYDTWDTQLSTSGGTASLQFTDDRTVYTANEGAIFVLDYLDDSTLEIENGSFTDIYATETSDAIELISAGSTFRCNDDEFVFTLSTAGNYNLNGVDITASKDNTKVQLSGDNYDTVTFAADAGITVTANDKGFRFGLVDSDGNVKVTSTENGDFGVSSGSITFGDEEFSISKGTVISLAKGEQTVTLTATKDISAPIKIEEGIYYLDFDAITADVAVTQDEQKILGGELEIDGVFSYNPDGGTFGLTGGNSSHGSGSNTSLQFTSDSGLGVKLATNDTTVVFVPSFADGKLNFNFPNERKDEMLFTLSSNGKTIFENQVTIAGTVSFDVDAQEISLTKGTVLTLTQGDNAIEITALADAGGKLTFVDNGIKFAPNTGDGQLELNFVSANRKANIDVTGAIILGEGGKISLEKGTEVNFTWDDGAQLKLTSKGSTGSIGLDEKGIKITSEDENLTIDLTLATGDQTHLSGIKGTIYYNAGTVSFDENSTITATTTLGGESILMTLETIGGTGHLDFASNGVIYSADTGAMRITWKNEDDLESTFTVNSGSVQIGHGLFQISEGTDLATDLKDFVPALYFTTSEAGTYTINKQTIETTAENISMTATDYYMTFKTSDDPVKYDGMNFAGAGNVSLTTDGVVLGAGVVADGFGIDKSFILAEAGNVTADARIFELTEAVPPGLTVTGAQDGFIFSRVNTQESEFRFDDPDLSNVGKIFTEQFFLTNDDSYRIQSDLLGLQKIIGVSAPSTLHAAASFGEDDSYSVFDIVTDSEGTFNIGEKDYSISGDDEVAVKSRFFDGLASVTAVNDLNGTISGDFTAHEVSINGSASAVQVFGDENISIAADDNGFEISGLDTNASLKVAATDTYIVNNTTINANGGDYIMGLDNGAALYGVNNDTIITGTEGNDTIQNIGTNVTIQALGGDDSISNSGDNASIDAGAGSNQIKLSGSDEVIVLKGQTSVEGFNTGFGDGSDTIYIHTENDPAGVEFLDDGLTFGNDTASLTLSDVNTTAKVNLFHENRDMLNKGVFIAPGDWYSVEDSDLTVDAGEEVYFVGTAAEPKAGVDFSGITGDLNLTLDTAYIDSEEYVEGTTTWINGVYSIVGGAGNTTITGSKLDDTIISGAGDTTINAAKGDDLISLSGGSALITYSEGDGNDTIYGFDSDSTLSPDTTYRTQVSGNDLIVTIGESKITLIDAANLTLPNIESSNPIVQVVEAILKRTAAGYPVIAGRVFNPEEITGPEPTNYAEKEDWTITSADGLELYGVHYTPENSNDKWVVLVHGYGCMYESMNPFATFYLANDYNVLMIDQRAAGKSEGTWLTMGVAESQDVALWTQEIANRYPDSKITLHGVSMGAATAILTAARQDAVNVTSIVEDCGYSDVMKTFETIVADHPELAILGISSDIIPYTDPVAESLTGYYLHDAAPINSIASVTLPSLFISGDDDGVAPVSMLHELYDASGAEVKEKFIVQGAGHARSGLVDPVGYSNSVFRFISEANGEGWETSNRDDNISLRGTKYNDTLANSGENVTIDSGAGDDDISNIADNVAIFSGDGNDTIYNHADNITIDAGLGNNSISNNSDNVVFIWSGGDDTIDGFKEDSVLQIAATKYSTKKSGDDIIVTVGDDEIVLTGAASLDTVQIIDSNPTVISNSANDTLITGTGGDDSIENSGDNVTIKVYGGDDTINNTGANAIIDGSDGADSISNYSPTGSLIANGVSVNAGAGNDTIQNHHAYYVTLEGGSGDDHITVFIGNQTYIDGGIGNDTILGETVESDSSTWAMGGYATIDGGDGNDYIDPGFSDSASIMGGDGNDTIINEGDDATINGGAGNDVISLHGASLNNDVIKYDVGSGNDSIFGFNETSQLSITAGTEYETQISGDDVLVTVGEDVLTITGGENVLTIVGGASLSTINIVNYEVPALELSNTTNNTLITGTELADTIENTGTNVTISGRASNDEIYNSGANGSLDGGAGNDSIENSGANTTIEGYYGDDYLTNSGDGVSIGGNYGNDIITNSGSNVTINPGSGDNVVINTGSNVLIEFTGGQDSVWGFNATSTLKTAAGASSVRVDGDIVVTVGDDSITLVDAASVIPEGIVLTKKGTYTIDGKIFELTKNVSSGVTITSAQDGFTTAITNPDGKIFIDEFSAIGDDSYTAQIDGKGLQTVSGINTGTEITTSATLDGEEEENEIYIVTEDAGSYTFNDMDFTTSEDNAVIRLRPQAMAFDSSDGILYDGKTFTGSGFVTVTSSSYAIGAGVVADGFNSGESFILMQRGAATVDGKTFELTENVKQNMTVGVEDGGYTFSHEITQKEIVKNNVPSDYLGKIYSENVIVEGDETYSLRADSFGLKKLSGISNGATINGGDTSIDGNYNDKYAKSGQHFYVDTATDTEGTFTFGEKTYTISGDSNVEIKAMFLPEKSYASGFASLDGTVSGDFAGDEFSVNGKKIILVEGDDDFYVVGGTSGTKLLDISDGASLVSLGGVKEVHTDTEGVFWLAAEPVPFGVTVTGDDNVTFGFNAAGDLMSADNLEGSIRFSKGTGGELSINGIGIHIKNTAFSSIGAYDDSLYIHDIERGTISAGEKVWLEMTGETMTLNGNELTLTGDDDGIWIRDKEIVGLDENASLQVSKGGTYLANETELKAKAGDVIIGLENNDAYIYDANNPLVTKNTSTEDLEKIFAPENTEEISSSKDITLEGGNLAIVEDTAAQVNITAGDDTIVSKGENVHVTLTPEKNTWLFPLEGKMTLEGYDETTGTGFGTMFTDIPSAVEDGRIDFNNGWLKLGSAQVDVGSNSALMNFFDRYGRQQKIGYASQGDSLDVSNSTDDLILVAKENSTLTGGLGNDTILADEGSLVDAGAGNNLIKSDGANVAFNGRTTVEGEVDTIYIANADPGVDFKSEGLTFYDNTVGKSLTFSGVTTTQKMNLHYAASGVTSSHVFIADDEWYNVSDGAADYYVGATAKKNHGIDFSGVSDAINVTMNTDYNSTTADFWVNNIHSIRGGAGNTTIIGSDKNDTIIAGAGETSIWGGAGQDKMFGNTSANKNVATFYYMAGDGRDSIENFDFMTNAQDVTADKIQLDDNSAITEVLLRGSDVMIKVDGADGFLMIEDAKGKSFRLNDDLVAKVDTNVSFDGFTNSYVGIGTQATLTVEKGLGNVEVWLSDDSLEYHGKMYDGNFKVLDASQSDGSNILAGNEQNNSIFGGAGNDSLWGGYNSENDTLIGGAGQNTFFYLQGNGRDVIQNAHDGDNIILDDITLDQIADANITAGGVAINFTDGGSLTINGTADVIYQLADGSKYSANHLTLEWNDK